MKPTVSGFVRGDVGHMHTVLALLLRWSDQRLHGRRCRWCGVAGARRGVCSAACRDQLSVYWDLGN